MSPWIAAMLLAAAAGAISSRPAVEDPPPAERGDAPERLDAWPKLESADKIAVEVEKLRKARTEQMETESRAALVAAGAGVAPTILGTLVKENDEGARARLVAVLDAVTDARHTRLLAREFEHKSPRVRFYALRRVASFPDLELRAQAEKALERARAAKEDEELYLAALCATAAGSLAGFDRIERAVASEWKDRMAELRIALASVRGAAATERVLAALKPEDRPAPRKPPLAPQDRQRVVAALRLLAACGDASAVGQAGAFLDSDDNQVRVAAINAVRALLDGAPPLDDLPVFDAIDMAKKLKERL